MMGEMQTGVLDLCNMSLNSTKRMNEIFDIYSKAYTQFVDELSDVWGKEVFWWVNQFSSRNIFLSAAYKQICITILAIEMIEKGQEIKKIKVPAKEIEITLKRYIKRKNYKIKIEVEHSHNIDKYIFINGIIRNFINITEQVRLRNIVRKQTKRESPLLSGESILIETDVFSTCFSTGEYKARDFADILNFTEEKIFFLPYLFLNSDMTIKELIRCMVESKQYKFIYRENYLKLFDYIKATVFPFYCRKYCKSAKVFQGIDVTEIVNADIMQSLHSKNSLYGILNYYFIQRIKNKNIDIKSLIGWYEGQPSSLGLFMSFRQNYIDKNSVGYAAYPLDARWLQIAPSYMQQKYKVVPQKIGVAAQIFEKVVKQFSDTVKTIIVPSFRMQRIYEQKVNNGTRKQKRILVALPYFPETAYRILKVLSELKDFLEKRQLKILLKNHPTKATYTLNDYGYNELEIEYEFINGDFDSIVQMVDVVLTCASTTTYETVLSGKNVIIISLSSEIVLTYLPSEWEGKRYIVAHDTEDIMRAIEIFVEKSCEALDLSDHRYLTKADKETVRVLLED
ncbi:MAG: hypothetical protein NC434_02735 [Ruminococcus sp.]|nr:hypothetical protein [Ruminococcus sp.]